MLRMFYCKDALQNENVRHFYNLIVKKESEMDNHLLQDIRVGHYLLTAVDA